VMASIITSISLNEETLEIKNRVVGHYQFSKFVRACLMELDAQVSPTHTTHEDSRVHGLCNGLYKPVCVICWPDGAPSRADWKAFATTSGNGSVEQPSAEKQRVVKSNFTHDYTGSESKQTPTRKSAQKGLIRRLLAWLI